MTKQLHLYCTISLTFLFDSSVSIQTLISFLLLFQQPITIDIIRKLSSIPWRRMYIRSRFWWLGVWPCCFLGSFFLSPLYGRALLAGQWSFSLESSVQYRLLWVVSYTQDLHREGGDMYLSKLLDSLWIGYIFLKLNNIILKNRKMGHFVCQNMTLYTLYRHWNIIISLALC